jgi:hypothetical protein
LFCAEECIGEHGHRNVFRTASVWTLHHKRDCTDTSRSQDEENNSKVNNQHFCALCLLNSDVPDLEQRYSQNCHREDLNDLIYELKTLNGHLKWMAAIGPFCISDQESLCVVFGLDYHFYRFD